MKVIERAIQRLKEEERQHKLGADNENNIAYWSAYLDGAFAQIKECTERLKAVNDEFCNKR